MTQVARDGGRVREQGDAFAGEWAAQRRVFDQTVDAELQVLDPTQKPATLHEKALRRCTKPGDAVLDLTAGSGSLMIAAEQMKRRAFLSEVDPVFATLIINRYEKLTGGKAKRIS